VHGGSSCLSGKSASEVRSSAIRFFSSRFRRAITSAQSSSAVDVCQTIAFSWPPPSRSGPILTNRKIGASGSARLGGAKALAIAQFIEAHATTPNTTSSDPRSNTLNEDETRIGRPPRRRAYYRPPQRERSRLGTGGSPEATSAHLSTRTKRSLPFVLTLNDRLTCEQHRPRASAAGARSSAPDLPKALAVGSRARRASARTVRAVQSVRRRMSD
jgi:hypothetical protein